MLPVTPRELARRTAHIKGTGCDHNQSAYMVPMNFQDVQYKIKEYIVIWDYARGQKFMSQEGVERSL